MDTMIKRQFALQSLTKIMSSQLQAQVERLREKAAVSQPLSTGRSSLFLNPKEAAAINVESIYEAAIDGLKVLVEYDSRLSYYLGNILSDASVNFQRELKTKEENKELDKQIHSLLVRLSPFMNELSAHKVLEYLIRRYRINEFNIDMLVKCCLPRHDTKLFVRVVQICKFDKRSRWSFLDSLKTTQSPLPRAAIVQQCHKNVSILESVFEIASLIVKMETFATTLSDLVIQGVDCILSFVVAIFLEMSERYSLHDTHLRVILSTIFDGMKSNITISSGYNHPCNQFRRCCSMILLQITRKIPTLAAPLKSEILKCFLNAYYLTVIDDHDLDTIYCRISNELLSSMIVASQYQVMPFAKDIVSILFRNIDASNSISLLNSVEKLKSSFKVSPFCAELLKGVLSRVIALEEQENNEQDIDEANNWIASIISKDLISLDDLKQIVSDELVSICSSQFKSPSKIKMICQVSHRYSNMFDDVIQSLFKTFEEAENHSIHALKDILMAVLNESQHRIPNDDGLSLVLGLNHPINIMRISSLKKIAAMDVSAFENSSSDDISGLCEAIASCLTDDDFDVAQAAWDPAVIRFYVACLQSVSEKLVFEKIRSSFAFWYDKSFIHPKKAIEVLIRIGESMKSSEIVYVINRNKDDANSVSFIQWLVFTAIHILYGSLRCSSSDIATISHLEIVVYDVCYAFRHNISLLKKVKSNISMDRIRSHICEAVSSTLSSNMIDLQGILSRLSEAIKGENNHISQAMICFISDVIKDVNKNKLKTMAHELSEMIVPISIEYFKSSDKLDNIRNDLLHNIIELVSHLPSGDILTAVDELSIGAEINFNHPKMVLLLEILSNLKYADYFGLILKQFPNYFDVLLKIAESGNSSSSSDSVDDSFSIISSSSKVGCLHVLGSLIALQVDRNILTADNQSVLRRVVPIMIEASTNVNFQFRQAGLSLSMKLSKLSQLPDKSMIDSEMNISVKDVIYISNLICSRASMIHDDPNILVAIISDIFLKKSKDNDELAKILLWCLSVYGMKNSQMMISLMKLVSVVPLEMSWSQLKRFFSMDNKFATYSNKIHLKQIAQLLSTTLCQINSVNMTLQEDIVQTICSDRILRVEDKSNALGIFLREELLECIARKQFRLIVNQDDLDVISPVQRLYNGLTDELLKHPGNRLVFSALIALDVPLQIICRTILQNLTSFNKLFSVQFSSNNMDEDSSELGFTNDIEKLTSFLQVSIILLGKTSFAEVNQTQGRIFGNLAMMLFALFEGMIQCHQQLEVVLSFESTQTTILDLLIICLENYFLLNKSSNTTQTPAKTPRKSKKAKEAVSEDAQYDLNNTGKDIEKLLKCLTYAKSVSLQSSAMRLIEILVKENPQSSIIQSCILALSELLSTSTKSGNIQYGQHREDFLKKTLAVFHNVPTSLIDNKGDNGISVDFEDTLQPFCIHFSTISSNRRSDLVRIAMESLSIKCLPVLVVILLTHSISAFDDETVSSIQALSTSTSGTVDDKYHLLLLSRAAQKKAHRHLLVSQSEELYRQSVELVTAPIVRNQEEMKISTDILIANLAVLLKLAQSMIITALSDSGATFDGLNEDIGELETTLAVTIDDHKSLSVDSKKTLSYFTKLYAIRAHDSNKDANDVSNASAVGLGLMILEYIADVLRNKSFHRLLIQYLETEGTGLHNLMLIFSEQLLACLNLSAKMQLVSGPTNQKQSISAFIGGEKLSLNMFLLGKTVESLSMDNLLLIQRLLDTPLFVQIMEDLLVHENHSIRYQSLQILSNRLDSMREDQEIIQYEGPLFVDLIVKLRSAIQETVLPISNCFTASSAVQIIEIPQISLCQSALLCIDAVTRYLMRTTMSEESLESIYQAVDEVIALSTLIQSLLWSEGTTETDEPPGKKSKTPQKLKQTKLTIEMKKSFRSYLGLIKLLGSVFLSCGTLGSALGPRCLPFLQTMITSMLHSCERTINNLKSNVSSDSVLPNQSSIYRAEHLLLRSTVSSLSTLIQSNSQFIHPYLDRIFNTIIPWHEMNKTISALAIVFVSTEIDSLSDDVDSCLDIIATKVPSRLLVPVILKVATGQGSMGSILAINHHTASRFIQFVNKVWNLMTRSLISTFSSNLCALATLSLDYRRVYGDQSEESNLVDISASNAVVDLSLKFTEAELKSFLGKLTDWKDIDHHTDSDQKIKDWRELSRNVTFYSLIHGLAMKLKVIFLPTMASLWQTTVSQLKRINDGLNADITLSSDDKKSKRKRSGQTFDSDNVDKRLIVEYIQLMKHILQSITICASNDEAKYLVDEERFGLIMPLVSNLIGVVNAFSSTTEYLSFNETYIIPCLTALAVSVGTDLQWKPLNHKILTYLRDERKPVRLVALKILQKLFTDLGEEYLVLLPECLPYLSEMMEDDDKELVGYTNSLIRNIEELAGEKLDVYLQ